jgi:hypothetical protein
MSMHPINSGSVPGTIARVPKTIDRVPRTIVRLSGIIAPIQPNLVP